MTSASYDGLVACQNSLHEFYEANAMWCFNRKTRGKIRTVKLDGRPVWAPGYSLEGGNTVLGDEYFIMGSMPDVAANSISVAYGDWKNAYRIVDRFGVRLIRDNLTNKPFIMLYTTFRVGGDILKWDALKLMKTA